MNLILYSAFVHSLKLKRVNSLLFFRSSTCPKCTSPLQRFNSSSISTRKTKSLLCVHTFSVQRKLHKAYSKDQKNYNCVMNYRTNPPLAPIIRSAEFPLTTREIELFDLLLEVLKKYNLSSTLRVAGGWVRDKLLERKSGSVDIDIALDDMIGLDFAKFVNDYLSSVGMPRAHIQIIEKNQQQSKHLEAARMKILGLDIDMVNLRADPAQHAQSKEKEEIGTPLEDALLRDLTINSMFYNVNNKTIEDFTGLGFQDLESRLVRTPIPALKTFSDDPLRLLRAIRFAILFDFEVHGDLIQNCSSHLEIRQGLANRVAKERITTELYTMFNSPRAFRAMGLIHEMDAYSSIFRVPENVIWGKSIAQNRISQLSLGYLINGEQSFRDHFQSRMELSANDLKLMRIAAFMIPYSGSTVPNFFKSKTCTLSSVILFHNLKFTCKDNDAINIIHTGSQRFANMIDSNLNRNRLQVGLLLRDIGTLWPIAFLVSLASRLDPFVPKGTFVSVPVSLSELCRAKEVLDEELISQYVAMYDWIKDQDLVNVHQWPPLLSGKALFTLFPKLVKGPVIGNILKAQMEWQIENPALGKEECTSWIKDKYPEYL